MKADANDVKSILDCAIINKEVYDKMYFLGAYQSFTKASNIAHPEEVKFSYVLHNLVAEAGEVAGVHAKHIRDSTPKDQYREKMNKELGDLLWHVSEMCNLFGWKMEDVMMSNMKKIVDRAERNKMRGEGDNR